MAAPSERVRHDAGAMSHRRRAREIALQILYQLDCKDQLSDVDGLALFWKYFEGADTSDEASPEVASKEVASDRERGEAARQFAALLVRGVDSHRTEIDELLARVSRNWRLERMARVDRSLLRLAVFELKHGGDVPAKVAINEAIEIAKRFGTGESSAFVNGILDRCLEEIGAR